MTRLKLLVVFHIGLGVQSCMPAADCENRVRDSIRSPNGALSAVVFSRECGATTSENIQVSIVMGEAPPLGKGNALVMDRTPSYSSALAPEWVADTDVVLIVPAGARVFRQETQASGVSIQYRTEADPESAPEVNSMTRPPGP